MDPNRADFITVVTPNCAHNNNYVIETRPRSDGAVRRRYECRDCGKRWTVIREGERPPRQPRKPVSRGVGRKLTLQQVHQVLTDLKTPSVALAAELGVSRQLIQQIRSGAVWGQVFPELPRIGNLRSCLRCRHWSTGECAIGFPDPLEEGLGFAADCDFYEMRQPQSRHGGQAA